MNFGSSLNKVWETTHVGEMEENSPLSAETETPVTGFSLSVYGTTWEQPPRWPSKHQQQSKAGGVHREHQAPGTWRVPR